MNRFVAGASVASLIAVVLTLAGCGGGLTTGSVFAPSPKPAVEGVAAVSNEDPLARPVQVAWTSARAHKCGFYFDPGKLRANYLGYEAKQGIPADSLAKYEKTYDTTYQTIWQKILQEPGYCNDKRTAEIKADLQRHLAGDYAPNLPKPKVETAGGGLFDVDGSAQSNEPFSSKKFWDDQAAKANRR